MSPSSPQHSLLDDAQGISLGALFCALGAELLQHIGLLTGQTAGLGLLVTYATSWPFWAVFFVVNLPFYWLAWTRMGPAFTAKSVVGVTLFSTFSALLPHGFSYGTINPGLGAFIAGAIVGSGLLMIIRHGGSLGGLGVLSVYLQDKTGFKAGHTQMLFDAALFAVAALFMPLALIGWSLLGAATVNIVIARNHRRDWYVAR